VPVAAGLSAASYGPLLAAWGVLAGAIAMLFRSPGYPFLPFFLGIIGGALVLTPANPAWVLAPVLLAELSAADHIIGNLGLSLRLAIVGAALILALPAVLRHLDLTDGRIARVLFPAIALIGMATFANFLFSESAWVIKYLRYQLTQLATLVLFACVVRDRRSLRGPLLVVLAFGVLAGIASIWQHFDRDSALYATGSAAHVGSLKGRSVGLTTHAVNLANDLLFVLMPLLGVLAVGPLRADRTRILLGGVAGLVGLGLYFTYTRSIPLAVGAGLIVIALFLKGHRRTALLGVVVGAVLFFQMAQGTGLVGHRYYRTADEDVSALSHEVLWQLGLAVALDNPVLGIGNEHFEEVVIDYFRQVTGAEAAAGQRPHNDFLNVWLSWGTGALLAYLLIFAGSLANYIQAARRGPWWVRGLAVGGAGGLVAYGVNSAFHNSLDSSTFLWVYAGLSAALARLEGPEPGRNRVVSRAGRTFRVNRRNGVTFP
jgi:O-antigen ligase